jgi:hypothetical protein
VPRQSLSGANKALFVVATLLGLLLIVGGVAFTTEPRFSVAAAGATIGLAVSTYALFLTYKEERQSRSAAQEKIERIEVKAEQEPEKSKFAWDLARAKLEAYFDRNLSQVRMIFVVAVVVMAIGFAFVLWGVMLAISHPGYLRTSYIAAISGIITQFIGATFMMIYRSTMTQANRFMEVLERINTVGMAVQILDAIPETNAQLKNSTRAELVALLVSAGKSRTKSLEKVTGDE